MDTTFVSADHLRILLVDDSPDNRFLFANFLKDMPVSIDQTGTGEDALEALRHKEYDYIFLDMLLPDSNGLRVLNRMREIPLTKFPTVYAFTAAASAMEAETYASKGFKGMVPKPFTKETLRMALQLV